MAHRCFKNPTEAAPKLVQEGFSFRGASVRAPVGGGDHPMGVCRWSLPAVGRGSKAVHNLFLSRLQRTVTRMMFLLGHCVFAICYQNDIEA